MNTEMIVKISKHFDSLSPVDRWIYQEPSIRPIKLIPTQAIANEAASIGKTK
jgi:hypothetical protein